LSEWNVRPEPDQGDAAGTAGLDKNLEVVGRASVYSGKLSADTLPPQTTVGQIQPDRRSDTSHASKRKTAG